MMFSKSSTVEDRLRLLRRLTGVILAASFLSKVVIYILGGDRYFPSADSYLELDRVLAFLMDRGWPLLLAVALAIVLLSWKFETEFGVEIAASLFSEGRKPQRWSS